jgi:putative transcriptional regulator
LTFINIYDNFIIRGDDMGRNISIKVARAELDMTQKALADEVGISRQTMNAIEQGEYNPTIKLCRAICRVLGKSLDELFGGEDEHVDK